MLPRPSRLRSEWTSRLPLMLLLFLTGPAHGAPDPSAHANPQPQIDALREEVRELRAAQNRFRTAERGMLGELEELARQMALADRELELARAEASEQEERIAAFEVELGRGRERAARTRRGLRTALRSAYSRRAPDWLLALVVSDSPDDLPRTLRLIGFLNRGQLASLRHYEAENRAIQAAQEVLRKRRDELGRLHQEVADRRTRAAQARLSREAFLSSLSRRREQVESELAEASGRLQNLLGGLVAQGPAPPDTAFPAARRRLPWPVDAPVARRFGLERHPQFRTSIARTGVDLKAAAGSTVRAVHAAEVVYADWFRGYGLLAILAHGDGYYTLYGHLSTLLVNRGARVSRGTAIGRSGDTGSLDGPKLYFEIRKGQKALDPLAWLSPR